MKRSILSLLFAFPLILAAQKTETRLLEDFDKLFVTGKTFTVEVYKADTNKIEVISHDLTFDKIITEVKGGELKVRVKGIFTTGNVRCKLYCKKIPSIIEAGNAALIKAEDEALEIPQISLTTEGDGTIIMKLKSTNINAVCNSSGDMTLLGSAQNFNGKSNANSTLRVEQMDLENATVKATLNAEIHLKASKNINATTATGGKIYIQKPYAENIIESSEKGGQIIRD